ncbi:hypothetical protein V3C99_000223 [Haemonchus contortus]
MGLPVMPFDLQQQRKQYRAPFKVQFVQWNPCSDLLALASRKGEVMVKRNMWKRCWRLNLSELTAFPESHCTKPACVESMTWSPDGAILAVAMNDGHLHLIEAEQGVVRWSRRLGQSTCAQRMRWFWSDEPPKGKSRLRCDWPEEEEKAVASIFGNGDIVDERLGKSLLYQILYMKSLRNTILFMIRDDFVVLALAGGIIPVSEIRLVEKLSHLKLDVINIYDVLYTKQDGLTIAVTDYGPRPKLDEVDRDPICTRSSSRLCGEFVADPYKGESLHSEKKFGSPSFMADAINCPHTHLVNIDFRLKNEDLLWELLLRYLKMYHCLVHLTYSMELAKKDWESESKIFANRLNTTPHDLRLGDALLNSLLGGAPGPLAERWLERTLGAAGIQSMREFVEKKFSGLVALLRGQLSAAARSLAFQMDQYRELVVKVQDANLNYENLVLPSWTATSRPSEFSSASSSARIPDVTADHVFDALDSNTSRLILDRLHSGGIRIQAKCAEMTQAATSNLRELSQLVRWMSLLTPLLKNTKRPAQIMEQNCKWDVANLLKYIVQTFTADRNERELLSLSLFKIEEVLKELRAEETKEHFSHDELALKRSEDDRTLSELLSSARKCPDSPMCEPTDTSTPRANPTHCQVQNDFVLDKVNPYWSEGLAQETKNLLGDRFGLEGVKDVTSLEDKSLLDVINEVTEIVQGASLLMIQSDANVKVKWMYELASDASHCGFDSVRLSLFKWSNAKDMDVYERKLFGVKGKDLEGAICASTISRGGLECECLLPRGVGKLRAGVQQEMSVSVAMQSGGFVETTPVQNEAAGCAKTDHQSDAPLQLVTDENAVFGNITKFLSVEMYAGGHIYALATFKSEAGEMNRLMRKHPMMEAWFVHSGLTADPCDLACLSTDRQQGCIVSEEGCRVALFRVQNSSIDEQPSTLLTEAPVQRPALQLLTHHTR